MIKLLVILIVSCISLSDACSCIPRTNQQKYCDSQYAAVIKVLTPGSNCSGSRCYGISVVQQIKGTAPLPNTLRTAISSAACGVSLISGRKYFVAGSKNGNILGLNSCQLYQDWNALSQSQINTNINGYKRIRCWQLLAPLTALAQALSKLAKSTITGVINVLGNLLQGILKPASVKSASEKLVPA